MGYFAHLYVIDCSADQDGVTVVTNIFGSEIAPTTYFSWGVGQRPPGMYEYADGTVVSSRLSSSRTVWHRRIRRFGPLSN